MNTEDCRTALRRNLSEAARSGRKFVDINSGKLHREVGGYPGVNHRMKSCCDVMRDEMTIGDRIVATPKKGNGASLTISYRVPRRSS
jgi:5-methylcytosine-specific restriction protein A